MKESREAPEVHAKGQKKNPLLPRIKSLFDYEPDQKAIDEALGIKGGFLEPKKEDYIGGWLEGKKDKR